MESHLFTFGVKCPTIEGLFGGEPPKYLAGAPDDQGSGDRITHAWSFEFREPAHGSVPCHMALADGGYFLHASTNPKSTGVWHKKGTTAPVQIKADAEVNHGGGPIQFYKVSLYPKQEKSPSRPHVPEAWR